MPNRIVREGCLDSERVDALSEQAENFYKRLWNVVDDYGRFEVDPVVLLSKTYPRRVNRYSPEMVDGWLAECTRGAEPLITTYRVGRKKYLQVNDFRQRERTPSKYPCPKCLLTACICEKDGAGSDQLRLSDKRQPSAGLACAASRDASDTPPPTDTATQTHTAPEAREGTDSAQTKPGRRTIAAQLAGELHKRHPEPCSLPAARAAAEAEITKHPDIPAESWAESARRNHAAHREHWLAERERKPGAYVPALHAWFRDAMYVQSSPARASPTKSKAAKAHAELAELKRKERDREHDREASGARTGAAI